MMAYERGGRKELGHLQGIARLLTHGGLKERIRRWIRLALLLASGMYVQKIGFAFFTGQTWKFMGGYVQKDMASRITASSRGHRSTTVSNRLYFSRMPPFNSSKKNDSACARTLECLHARTLARSHARTLASSHARKLTRSQARTRFVGNYARRLQKAERRHRYG